MTKHILKYTSWQSGSGQWYCNDTSDLAGIAGYWWVPARMLNLSPVEYVQWLVDNYKPDCLKFNGETLIYSWNKEHYNLCNAFVLKINKIARQKRFLI